MQKRRFKMHKQQQAKRVGVDYKFTIFTIENVQRFSVLKGNHNHNGLAALIITVFVLFLFLFV